MPRPTRRTFLSTAAAAAIGWCAQLRGEVVTQRAYVESAKSFPNPERGFYAQRSSARMDRIESLRTQDISLLLVTFDLRDFRERDLTEEKLGELGRAFATAREHGFKVIFRAAYGFTSKDYRVDPHDLGLIAGHIRQISAVLRDHVDVLTGIQAGMLGPWGEWHGSNHGNPPSLEARRAVLFAWLENVPAPITVHVRRPMFIRDICATEPGGYDLKAADAFSGSPLSRTGWHDDAFLAAPSDLGTYAERGWDRERELAWCSRHGRYTPFGGETVQTNPPMPIPAMIREMERLHATYLNIGYHPKVVQLWRDTEYAGENTFAHIARRLGYRFTAERLAYARAIRAGDSLPFDLTLKNVGFASPHLPRVVFAGLLGADAAKPAHAIVLPQADPRRWGPEDGLIHLQGALRLPSELSPGTYRLGLRLADASERLRDDGRYAIRLANDDIVFAEADGWNIMADDIICG